MESAILQIVDVILRWNDDEKVIQEIREFVIYIYIYIYIYRVELTFVVSIIVASNISYDVDVRQEGCHEPDFVCHNSFVFFAVCT